MTSRNLPALLLLAGLLVPPAAPQSLVQPTVGSPAHILVPQARGNPLGDPGGMQIVNVIAGVVILEQVATTTLEITVRNPAPTLQQAELLVPVPDGVAVRSFAFNGSAAEPTAVLLLREEARRLYQQTVARTRDPALLEFDGCNVIRTCVFPVPPRGVQKLRLTYEHVLPASGARVEYELPRSESVEYAIPWNINVKITSRTPIATLYSPSHALDVVRTSPYQASVRLANSSVSAPGPFRLFYLLERDGIAASLLAYPDASIGGGYFLLLAGAPSHRGASDAAGIRREITLVLDRSGSMSGEKIEQVRAAALQIVAGLAEGEYFNIVDYAETVGAFSREPVKKDAASLKRARQYLQTLQARGGTNIYEALRSALAAPPAPGTLPIVLFLTDGLPTVGQTSEVAIRELVLRANPYERRVYTFGVGVDVNSPLLERLADETRARATFVLPGEDVEVKVARVFDGLNGPVLAEPVLTFTDARGRPVAGRVLDLLPNRMPDLYEDDQLVVLGRYLGDEPPAFQLSGNYRGERRVFRFAFKTSQASIRNAFVPRLWASRKIAALVDTIRQMGADYGVDPAVAAHDPRFRELVDEVVRLGTEFGILTEYTAFLANEGTNLARRDEVVAEAARQFQDRAIAVRSGLGSVTQSMNSQAQKGQQALNMRNEYLDQRLNRVAITNVQQVGGRAYYQRGGRWIDSHAVKQADTQPPSRIVEIGSAAFDEILRRLTSEGRQSLLMLKGDVLIELDGEVLLLRVPAER